MATTSIRSSNPDAMPAALSVSGSDLNREDTGLAALEGLTLEELGAIAAREIGEGRQLQAEAVGLSRRSTVTFYRAGRALWCARKKLKGRGKRAWTRWQRDHGISITSAWQAIRLYEAAESEEAVAELTRTQALRMYGITKPQKARPQHAPAAPGTSDGMVGTTPVERAQPESHDLRLVSGAGVEGELNAPAAPVSETVGAEQYRVASLPCEPHASEASDQGVITMATPVETLALIVRRLELLEREVRGDLDGHAHSLIDQAIAVLRRLRGDVTPVAGAA